MQLGDRRAQAGLGLLEAVVVGEGDPRLGAQDELELVTHESLRPLKPLDRRLDLAVAGEQVGALAQDVRLEHLPVELVLADAGLGGEPLALGDSGVEVGDPGGEVLGVRPQGRP